MQDATEFGKVLRSYMAEHNLCQEQLAEKLGMPKTTLSNYITGKNIPEMNFLLKCIKKLDLENRDMANLFYTAFLSTATSDKLKKVIFDTRFIDSARNEMLAKFLTILVLYPRIINLLIPSHSNLPGAIEMLGNTINDFYIVLEEEAELHPPTD